MDLITIGTGLATAVTTFAVFLPKIMAGLKRDQFDFKATTTQANMVDNIYHIYEKQITTLSDRLTKMELRVNEMDETIHVQAMKITRLIVVVIQLKSLLENSSVPLPEHLREEIDRLTTGPFGATGSKDQDSP
jgi:hypothetical protein